LFAGENGVGKTTLLDAIRIYASQSHYRVLQKILQNREEVTTIADEDGATLALDWRALFHDRHFRKGIAISIGPKAEHQKLHIKIVSGEEQNIRGRNGNHRDIFEGDDLILQAEFKGEKRFIRMISDDRDSSLYSRRLVESHHNAPVFRCESVGPELLSNRDIARFWDNVALTDNEDHALEALRLIFGEKVERVAVIGDEPRTRNPCLNGRRVIVKVKGEKSTIPLKGLGDGAVRLFGVALALANNKEGFVVIDEAENGIHHSVQRDFWRMVLTIAHNQNIQVFATTHSWDCVKGFAQAATELSKVDGRLVRIEKSDDQVSAVEYSEEELDIATRQHIEVR